MRCQIVRPEIGFDFNDFAGTANAIDNVDEVFT
jgi:hypothetical protein